MPENYTKIKNDRMRTVICDLMSEMIDNPNKHGIYPTSKFMSKMEDFCLKMRHEAIEWTWAKACTLLDKGEEPRDFIIPQLIDEAEKDLDKESLDA